MSSKIGSESASINASNHKHSVNKDNYIATQFGSVLENSFNKKEQLKKKIVAPDDLEKEHFLTDKDPIEQGKHMVPEDEIETPEMIAQQLKKKIKKLLIMEQKMLGL